MLFSGIYLQNQKGYSVIEVLMAIVIAGILFSAVIALYSNVLIVQDRTQKLEIATRAAHQQIESLRNLQYNALEEGEDINFSDNLPGGLPVGSTGIVEVSGADQGLKRVDVTVTYPFRDSSNSVTVTSLIGVIGITQ